ncbi:MAG: bifunctional (p)ppGpp synthetase/guanosine-3',5'-bis(diphosphate) 3'-pyrophosphohydrolase [Betaproteobacteria bacterium]|nr:bifunctional (p)ppGpp synthetase/guanosine-3',5'-bis(diphosphate) 3'-pyrophosphohydrolase [Betaproteobacteria bacterium]
MPDKSGLSSRQKEEPRVLPASNAPLTEPPTIPTALSAPVDHKPIPGVATFSHLTQKLETYLSKADMQRVREAFRYSDEMHLGQIRKSGEPYISHPLAVAEICADWKLDTQAIMAALLHDVMEDQDVKLEELIERFGAPVAGLVDGLSKLEKLQFQNHIDAQGENFRKMLLAMAKDVRVILIKLADRLHNMRTLDAMDISKRKRIARETMEVYVPIAHRLGINNLYREMQNMAFHSLYPYRYEVLEKAVNTARGNRHEVLGRIYDTVGEELKKNGIHAELYSREKTLYGIYRKMRQQNLAFSQVLDIYGFRVVVDTVAACYATLGVLHSLYKPMPGKVQDYIAIPKLNKYQSLHTTLVGPYGAPVEFQIRTHDMHHVAETGVAAHWLYKNPNENLTDIQKHSLGWLQSLLDIQQQTGNSAEFLEHVKVDLFPDSVYVFTPKSEIIALPREATALDFAYNIHTDVGNQTVAVKINNEPAPLRTELKNGDIVEIITSPTSRPNPSWLSFVRTGKARSCIRSHLRSINITDSIELGKRLLNQALQSVDMNPAIPQPVVEKLLYETGSKTINDIYMDIGVGKRLAALVARRIIGLTDEVKRKKRSKSEEEKKEPKTREPQPVIIYGSEGVNVQLATCCLPIPGDVIMGELNMTRGLVVHNAECSQAKKFISKEPEKWINVAWGEDLNRSFDCRLRIMVHEEKGILARVAAEISESNANIVHVNMETQEDFTTLRFTVQVEDRTHLANLMRRVRHIPGVTQIGRERN